MKLDLKKIKDFTLQILNPDSDSVVGTGFFISPDGYILTCYHVIEPFLKLNQSKISIRYLSGNHSQKQEAIILKNFCNQQADIAALKINQNPGSEPLPYLPIEIYEERWEKNHSTTSYGYPGGNFEKGGLPMNGLITGPSTEHGTTPLIIIEGLSVPNVDHGFSGAPVIYDCTEKVVGLIHAKFEGREHQAFFVPISEFMKSWKEMGEFHDVCLNIQKTITIDSDNKLKEKLRQSEYIPLVLQRGEVPENITVELQRQKKGYEEWQHRRKWYDIEIRTLLPPTTSYILSSSVGTGKTTFLRWLGSRINAFPEHLALFINCADFVRWSPDSWDDLSEKLVTIDYETLKLENAGYYVNKSDLEYYFKKSYENGKILFLYDGLDLISGDRLRYDPPSKMIEIANINKVIITSRPSAVISYEKDDRQKFLRLKPFSPYDEKTYFGTYYPTTRSIRNLSPELTKVPMLAYMIRELAEKQELEGIINRADLYRRFIDYIFMEHNSSQLPVEVQSAMQNRKRLGELSFHALNEKTPAIQIIPLHARYVDRNTIAQIPLFGLVNLIFEEGGGGGKKQFFFFTHQSFQEYLAAEFVNESDEYITHILSERWNPKWKEVIGFLVGMRGNEIIRKIIAFPENVIFSDLFLASELMDEVKETDLQLWQNILKQVQSIQNSAFNSEVIKVKGHLGNCRGVPDKQRQEIIRDIIESLPSRIHLEQSAAFEVIGKLADKLDPEIMNHITGLLLEKNSDVRGATVKILGELADKVDPEIMNRIVGLLDDEESNVRYAAVETLGKLADKVDSEIMNCIVGLLDDEDPSVRWGSVDTLGELADKVDPEIMNRIVGLLDNEESNVRYAAVATLGKLADKADSEIMNCIIGLLDDEDPSVRWRSVATLGELANKVDPEIMNRIVGLLDDEDPNVRWRSVEIFGELADKVDSEIMNCIVGLLDDDDSEVRSVAVTTLGILAYREKSEIVDHIARRFSDESSKVRGEAVHTFGWLSSKVEPKIMKGIVELLADEDSEVRSIAVTTLGNLADKVDQDIMNSIAGLLSDENSKVRCAAVKTLGNLADKVDQEIMNSIVELLADEDSEVRSGAVTTLGNLADKVDQDIMNSIAGLLSDESSKVRCAAVETLGNLADKVDQEIVNSIAGLIADKRWIVRRAAIETLGNLADKVDPDIMNRIAGLLSDNGSDVRRATVETLGKLAGKVDPMTMNRIAELLMDKNSNSRRAAIQTFSKLSNKVNQEIMNRIAGLVADKELDVRRDAIASLKLYNRNGKSIPTRQQICEKE